MTEYIVHIGDGKCGSSSIQASLYEAREALRDAGVVFETAVPVSGHFTMGALLGKRDRAMSGAAVDRARQSLEMIRTARRPGDTVLLSAESFFDIETDRLLGLLREIDPQIDRIDILAYVRAPHDMYLSLVQQRLKGDSRFTPPDAYTRDIHGILFRWRDAAEIDGLTVRNFDRAKLVGGDVIADFERQLHRLTGRDDIRLPRTRQNVSLSAEQLVALQRYRAHELKAHDGQIHRESQLLVRYFEELAALGFPGSKLALTEQARWSVSQGKAAIVERANLAFPGLDLELPRLGGVLGTGASWDGNGRVEQILARLDMAILELLEAMISGAPTANLRCMAERHGIDFDPFEPATRLFHMRLDRVRPHPAPASRH